MSSSNTGRLSFEDQRFLTTQEVAEILGVRVETVRNYIKRGKLPAVKWGRGYRIAQRDLEEFVTSTAKGKGMLYKLRDTEKARRIKETRDAVSLVTMPSEELPLREDWDIWSIAQSLIDEGKASELEARQRAEELLAEIREIACQLQAERPPYSPEKVAQARREMDEIRAILSANPPYPTLKAFMESSRGRGTYDPD